MNLQAALTPSLLIAILTFLTPLSLRAESSRINKSAQSLAKHLGATPPAKKASQGDLGKLRGRMIACIEILEDSYRTNGPQPESLISTALEFREEIAGWEKMLTRNAVLTAWREANGRGLFNEQGKFQDRITKGRGVGDRCTFELIVPAETYPPAGNQLSNLRLVPAKNIRKKDAPLTDREKAYHQQLVKLIGEKERGARFAKVENAPETNAVGQEASEALARWESAMAEAGDAAGQLPVIRIEGSVTGTPSHRTQERWRFGTEITNLSDHPTEVVLDVYLIGVTDRKRDHYLMSKTSHSLKLRQNENRTVDSFTRAEASYKGKADDHDEVPKKERNRTRVRCRGFVMIVRHGDKVAAFTGSDRLLTGYGDPAEKGSPLQSLPKF